MPESVTHRQPMPENACAAVILAAGASTRLGQAKQLVAIEGESLLVRTVRMAREVECEPIVVVTGFEAERMRDALADLPVVIAENADWRSGMGSSLRCGVAALNTLDKLNPPDVVVSDVLILVCDQIALSAALLREVLRVHARGERPITASLYARRAGVPAVFPAKYFPELLQVEGDRGARGILERHSGEVALVEFHDGVIDLDTPEQLRDLP
jgi:molybdenum cofactor cytidylyltransferase